MHPTKLLRRACVTLLRTLSLCAGIEAADMQPSARHILASLLHRLSVSSIPFSSPSQSQPTALPSTNLLPPPSVPGPTVPPSNSVTPNGPLINIAPNVTDFADMEWCSLGFVRACVSVSPSFKRAFTSIPWLR